MSVKKICRLAALLMLAAAAAFFAYAVTHPAASFPWGNAVTYCIYAAYLAVMALLFAASFVKKK